MLQVAIIREEKDRLVSAFAKRRLKNIEETLNRIISLDDERKGIRQKQETAQAEGNSLAKQIGVLMKEGKKEEAETLKKQTTELKEQAGKAGEALVKVETELRELLYTIPNVPQADVPEGSGPDENVVAWEHGTIPTLPDNALPHWDLIKKYDIIDFDLGNKISGAGFPVYKGKGAKLQRALINFFLDEAEKQGYREMQPPIVVNEASGYGTGQLPDKEGQMYFIGEDGLYLIPTAEVPITNLYRDVIVPANELPIKNAGYTPCFRREAGSWGAHVRGLNRLHQFDKVEIVQICKPEDSNAAHEEMMAYVQTILEKLELPYRRLLLCGGDMSFNAAKCYDMEVFSAAQKRWLEVSSISNFETFQANRLKLRYKNEEGKTQLLHTLNGSALALPRIVACILENNQTAEGIKIPETLIPYTKFDMI